MGAAFRPPTIGRVSTEIAVEIDGQYRAMKEGAGVLDRSTRGKLVVRGADAAEYLQGQLTNDIEALEPGSGCYAALLDRKGHLQADMRVLRLPEAGLWIDTEPEALPAVERHLRMYSIGRELEVQNASGEWALISLIGPAALEAAGSGPLSPEHSLRSYERDGLEIVAVASDLGVDLIAPATEADALRESLLAGDAVEVTEEAAEILRVESGRPRFGREMSNATIPQEAGIDERAVSFTKGCYIGQETVARLHYRGKPNRHLRGLRLDAPVSDGDEIRLGDREVGRVGTAVLSPALGPIALAIVRREAEPGAAVKIGEASIAGEIVDPRFVA